MQSILPHRVVVRGTTDGARQRLYRNLCESSPGPLDQWEHPSIDVEGVLHHLSIEPWSTMEMMESSAAGEWDTPNVHVVYLPSKDVAGLRFKCTPIDPETGRPDKGGAFSLCSVWFENIGNGLIQICAECEAPDIPEALSVISEAWTQLVVIYPKAGPLPDVFTGAGEHAPKAKKKPGRPLGSPTGGHAFAKSQAEKACELLDEGKERDDIVDELSTSWPTLKKHIRKYCPAKADQYGFP